MVRALREQTTLRVGGAPAFAVSVESVQDVKHAIALGRSHQLPLAILGGGSNVLSRDGDLPIVLARVHVQGISYVDGNDNESVIVEVGAGVDWDTLVSHTVHDGLWGLENLSGIPGTVGASPIQNVGAYGVEVAHVIKGVYAVNLITGDEVYFDSQSCCFGYRTSYFKSQEGSRYLVTRVQFRLLRKPNPKLGYKDLSVYFQNSGSPTLLDIRDAILSIRHGKFPSISSVGTAGSFFKNLTMVEDEFERLSKQFQKLPGHVLAGGMRKVPLAFILEALGYKGYRQGDVGLSERHALVLVNYGKASFVDIDTFAREIEHQVQNNSGIIIEREVVLFP